MSTRILLAEDNEQLAIMLRKFLLSRGVAATVAHDGAQALQLLSDETFDLLVLDLKLPLISGIDLLRTLRSGAQWKNLPVVIMTGVYKGERYVQGAQQLGVTHYLEKPFKPQDFLDAIMDALSGATSQAGGSFADIILDIYNKRRNGRLTIGKESAIVFLNGEPISFLSRGREDFPAFLVQRGKIDQDDLRLFIGSNEERLYFTQAGLLTLDELTEESRLFLSQKLIEAFGRSQRFEFIESIADVEFPLVPLSVPRLFYEASKAHATRIDPDQFIAFSGHLYPARTPLFFRRANLTSLREDDIQLLQRVNGKTPLHDIVQDDTERGEAAVFFHYLQALGMITFHPEPVDEAAPDFPLFNLFNRPLDEEKTSAETAVNFNDVVEEVAESFDSVADMAGEVSLRANVIDVEHAVQQDHDQIQGKNYYEIFQLTPGSFTFNDLRDSYFTKTRQYSPEKLMEMSGAIQALAQDILATYANAYNTLSNVVAKERYDEMLNANTIGLDGRQDGQLQAKIQYQSGKVFLEMGEFDNAEKALQDAYTLDSDNPEFCAYLAWILHLNPANSNSRVAQERARNLLTKSLQIEKTASAFTFRGMILLDEGRDGLAEGEFLKALKLDPQDKTARKGLRQITEKRENDKKGLFRRLFG